MSGSTRDNRYAVTFAGAIWTEGSSFLPHVRRQPDTIISVIDLAQWRIVGTIHTMAIADGTLSGVRIVDSKWIALDFHLGYSIPGSLNSYLDKLLTIPGLRSGPECLSDRPFRGHSSASTEEVEEARKRSDAACRDLLLAAGSPSVETLEVLIYRGQGAPPPAVKRRSHDLETTEDDFFRGWGKYPYYMLYSENPPFESSSHLWYGLYQQAGSYSLERFNSDGLRQKARTVDHLLCGDPSLEKRGSACGCRVIDVSEEERNLLAYCRTQNGDFSGLLRREWLAVLHSDDFSGAGFINLSRSPWSYHETLEQIAQGDGRSYVVSLESGERLRIYQIPARTK